MLKSSKIDIVCYIVVATIMFTIGYSLPEIPRYDGSLQLAIFFVLVYTIINIVWRERRENN